MIWSSRSPACSSRSTTSRYQNGVSSPLIRTDRYLLFQSTVLIASMIVDQSFGADPAWRYVTYLTVGYMISRGLAKVGSREPYRD